MLRFYILYRKVSCFTLFYRNLSLSKKLTHVQLIGTDIHLFNMSGYYRNNRAFIYGKTDGIGFILLALLFILTLVLIIVLSEAKLVTKRVIKKAIRPENDYFRNKAVLFDRLIVYTSKIDTVIKQFRMLFALGLIHRVNQQEVVYYSVTVPSYIIVK